MKKIFLELLSKVINFGFFSLIGLLLDLSLYLFLHNLLGIRPWLGNTLSSIVGTTFVFIFSGRYTFNEQGFTLSAYMIWVMYSFIIIYMSSKAIEIMSFNGFQPITSKLITIPVTFSSNFLIRCLLFGYVSKIKKN